MKLVELAGVGEHLSALCIGAHSDDIEIGTGATILGWIDSPEPIASLPWSRVRPEPNHDLYRNNT
jgi:LmbE family N-acetylglucosaminyl deacetylase